MSEEEKKNSYPNGYKTIQIPSNIKDIVTEHCALHDLKIGHFCARILWQAISGSLPMPEQV